MKLNASTKIQVCNCRLPYFILLVFLLIENVQAVESDYTHITIETAQPTWQFLLDNLPSSNSELTIRPNERSFVRKIQPLLSQKKYVAVAHAFAERPLDDDSMALQLLRGQVFISLKKYSLAEQALTSVLRHNPDLASAHKSISLIYMVKQQFSLAQVHLSRAIELGAADAQVYGQLAYVNLQLENAWSAISGYQHALYLEPGNIQWQQGLLFALINTRANQQADALLNQMLNRNVENDALWLHRSQLRLQQNNYEGALLALELAMRMGDANVDNTRLAAQLHLQTGSASRAVVLLSKNIRGLPRDHNSRIFETIEETLGWLAYNKKWKFNDQLLKLCQTESVKFTPEQNARLNVFRAKSLIRQGALHDSEKRRKAETWLTQALRIDPLQGEALMTLADLFRGSDRINEAEMLYIRAQVLEPYEERALLSHAQLLIDKRQYLSALQKLRKVLIKNPGRLDLNANIQSLEQLIRYES